MKTWLVGFGVVGLLACADLLVALAPRGGSLAAVPAGHLCPELLTLLGQDAGKPQADQLQENFKRRYSPYAGRSYPTRPFFGDTHIHTGFSMDVGPSGDLTRESMVG